ncbi:MAG: hypothetical protein ACFE0J_24165 [Elainellaceae cyanobacterium]
MSSGQLRLNLVEGSVSFSFTPQAAQEFKRAIASLMESLKGAANHGGVSGGNRPKPQPPMEFQYTGDIFLEVFCNPNIWPSPFAAKVLITLRDDRIRLTTEAELTRIIEDLNQYLDHFGHSTT